MERRPLRGRRSLARGGHTVEEVNKMHESWFKSLTKQVALWSLPYAKEGDF